MTLSPQAPFLLAQNGLRMVVPLALGVLTAMPSAARDNNHQLARPAIPTLSYSVDEKKNRSFIFMNNPEFLWFGRDACDLADPIPEMRKNPCARSLFNIASLGTGRYRAWWEHRNMMPFALRSGLLLTNNSTEVVHVSVENDAIETDSAKNGGLEFVHLFNSKPHHSEFIMTPGERTFLGNTANIFIASGNFFAGVVDFEIKSGRVTLDEVVFRKQPANELTHIGYSTRTKFNVHESLVYKGVSPVGAVRLNGAEFEIDDSTPIGRVPVGYRRADLVPLSQQDSTCQTDRVPPCLGAALKFREEPEHADSWVTHIAPDPDDANPKRMRAIISDLVDLLLPGSTSNCPSAWPQTPHSCMKMSHIHYWFLRDFKKWRLPNWGNWGVHYSHPITITNNGFNNRFAKVYITADGASPLAFRGTGLGNQWRQTFLDPKAKSKHPARILAARAKLPARARTELDIGFVLSGPGAGTLEHHIELTDSEDE